MQPTPQFTRTSSYKQWLIDEAQRAVAQAKAEANAPALAEQIAAAWARVRELRAAKMEFEASFVEAQARELMEGN